MPALLLIIIVIMMVLLFVVAMIIGVVVVVTVVVVAVPFVVLVLLFRFFNHDAAWAARAPSTACPLQDSVLAVSPSGDSALVRAALPFCV